jgi:flagellar assembly protein FliH
MMKNLRPYRFPPLSQIGTALPGLQSSHAEAFQEGMEHGYREGYDSGLENGRRDGLAQGYEEGQRKGREESVHEVKAHFGELAGPLDTMLEALQALQADYQSALRKEVVELVAKVARQVIRSELALQPVQLLSLVDETLATMPPVRDKVEVYLNAEELERIGELAPERVAQWTLIADPRLEPGECRVRAGDREADAGCKQRLAACMEQVSQQLLPSLEEAA